MNASGFARDIRGDFPFLRRTRQNGQPFIYLDSAATALKPQCVVDAVARVLTLHTANVHRAVHQVSDEATELFEGARDVAARFIGAERHEVVFVKNATEALNLVAAGWPAPRRVVTTLAEHHSNLLPWRGTIARLAPRRDGTLDEAALDRELARGDVGLVALSHCSNVTGVMLDAAALARRIHAAGALLVLDGAQSVPHQPVDVRNLDCDFLAFSGHKLGAPTGIGVLYGKAEHLERIEWHLRGGQTVDQVHADSVVAKDPPWRFEAGTPPIEAAAGLGAALGYLESVDRPAVARHQQALSQHALRRIRERVPAAAFLGPCDAQRVGPVSFSVPGLSPHTLARALSDARGICVRSGYHCCQPLHEALGFEPTLRASFYLYNTVQEVDVFAAVLAELVSFHREGTL